MGFGKGKNFRIFKFSGPPWAKTQQIKERKKRWRGNFPLLTVRRPPERPAERDCERGAKKAEYASTLVSLRGASLTTFREGQKSRFGQIGTESPTITRGGTESHFGQMGRKSHYLPRGARSLIVSRAHLRSLYSTRARN